MILVRPVTFRTFSEWVRSFLDVLTKDIFTLLPECLWFQCLKTWEISPCVGICRHIWDLRVFWFRLIWFKQFWQCFDWVKWWGVFLNVLIWCWYQLWSSFDQTVFGKIWVPRFKRFYFASNLQHRYFRCAKDHWYLNHHDHWGNCLGLDLFHCSEQDTHHTFSFLVKGYCFVMMTD